jgi:hypothetical protein
MIELPAKTYIWISAGVTDMRRGFQGRQCHGDRTEGASSVYLLQADLKSCSPGASKALILSAVLMSFNQPAPTQTRPSPLRLEPSFFPLRGKKK